VRELAETLKQVHRTPGLFALHGATHSTRYRTLVAFVEGIDIGTSREFMAGFRSWFRRRHSLEGSSSLTWDGEIFYFYMPNAQDVGNQELSDEDNDLLVAAAFDELILYASRFDG
jgi:hypothetical protein